MMTLTLDGFWLPLTLAAIVAIVLALVLFAMGGASRRGYMLGYAHGIADGRKIGTAASAAFMDQLGKVTTGGHEEMLSAWFKASAKAIREDLEPYLENALSETMASMEGAALALNALTAGRVATTAADLAARKDEKR